MSEYLTSLISLEGKCAIVIGATGGLGLEMTLSLAKSGAEIVAITLPNDPHLDTFRDRIKNAGQKLSVFEADVADTTSLRLTFKQMWETVIMPDILLNCAGINRGGNAEDLTDDDIDAVSPPI
jgi:2-deoxy-D-gluconate 3-dehydrogenase